MIDVFDLMLYQVILPYKFYRMFRYKKLFLSFQSQITKHIHEEIAQGPFKVFDQ
jgi:hypothetical protein